MSKRRELWDQYYDRHHDRLTRVQQERELVKLVKGIWTLQRMAEENPAWADIIGELSPEAKVDLIFSDPDKFLGGRLE